MRALHIPRLLLALLVALAPASLRAQGRTDGDVKGALERLAKGERIADLPPADSVAPGDRTVPAGTTVTGTIVARGPVDVAGTVQGSVVSLGGDVVVRPGGHVTGDALSVSGRVLADSGRVDGEIRTMSALPTLFESPVPAREARSATQRTIDAVKVVAGSFAVLLIVALGVLLFAEPNLAEVVETVEQRFARAFWVGLAGQLLVLPGVVVLCVALALTLLGVLLIPFAIVAYAIAVAGLLTLGFLAVAQLIGGAVWRGRDGASSRARAFGTLVVGVAIFFALWMVSALLVWAPLAATVIRAAAVAASWAAVTLGLGAAILSRAGTHRRLASGSRPVELASWQTPTPVAGVAAARRPAIVREAK
jgi:hypothetical protein